MRRRKNLLYSLEFCLSYYSKKNNNDKVKSAT